MRVFFRLPCFKRKERRRRKKGEEGRKKKEKNQKLIQREKKGKKIVGIKIHLIEKNCYLIFFNWF